jgi:hypothetical protein
MCNSYLQRGFKHILLVHIVKILANLSSELVPSFTKMYPISLTLHITTLKLGMKRGLEGQTWVQQQIDF